MAPNTSRRSSKTSIVSVDPTVASQITRGTRSKAHAGHVRTESTPAQATSTAVAALSKGHGRTNSAPNRNLQKRSNSLRRAKNSTELLKLRSASGEKSLNKVDPSVVKRGRAFTVSNVATGGLLHLSPALHQQPFSTSVTSPSPCPWMPPNPASTLAHTANLLETSQSAHQRTRSVSPKRLLEHSIQSKPIKSFSRAHYRSQSFSTLDESRKSIAAALQPKTLKIVINRPDSIHSSDDEEFIPTLQIPIPHYKLGTPRFSAHGTPFLRGSSHTRVSGTSTATHSTITAGVGNGPPTASLHALSKVQNGTTSDGRMILVPDALRVIKAGVPRKQASVVSFLSPISPDLYDKLFAVYNDPIVVRYTSTDQEIAAATKIRIIAQISSESFMDYDLVSDFFLTFRSYMTTFEVLDYLLARLKWSIGRLTDDGRIIRIRTFAALRHWILNYFAEDFVVNRHLRVRFCNEVNDLYESVRNRPPRVGSASDLKILQDLKRCWNGRCALYWDAEEFNMDSSQEDPLLPGGVIGSRNPAYADISEATAALGLGVHGLIESAPHSIPSTSSISLRKTHHKRLPSSDYAKKPLSIESEQSLQATSCSLPRRPSRSPDKDQGKPPRGPQPVTVLSRRQNAPADLKVHIHLRNGSGTNNHSPNEASFHSGEPTPVEALVNSGHYVDPHAGSMIRGFVYGPVEPFIHLPTNPPLSPSVRFSAERPVTSSLRVPLSPNAAAHGPQGPAVKNVFGSIRRALSGKQGSNEVTVITMASPQPSLSPSGRRAPVPINLAKSNDDLRRRAAGTLVKTELRIDLLCAAAVQSFQTVVPGMHDLTAENTPRAPLQPSGQQTQFSPPLSLPDEMPGQHLTARLPSHYTARSGSILIVDDTAVAIPVMSGALQESYLHQGSPQIPAQPNLVPFNQHQSSSVETQIGIDRNGVDRFAGDGHQEDEIGLAKSTDLSVGVGDQQNQSRTISAITVRKLGSSPSLVQHQPRSASVADSLRSVSPPPMTEATSTSESPVSKAPAHGLRRRPGGDLRNNQNVQDLESTLHHQSLDSMLESSSGPASMLLMSKPGTASSSPAQTKKPQKVSMINTHSSQHLRPSFKAALADFSAIPDDNDGGLEATLLKLEGRYDDKSPVLSNFSASPTNRSFVAFSEQPLSASTAPTDEEAVTSRIYSENKVARLNKISFLHDGNAENTHRRSSTRASTRKSVVFGLSTESHAGSDSEESDISLPILKRNTNMTKGQAIQDSNPLQISVDDDNDDARSSSDILEANHLAPHNAYRPEKAHTDVDRSFLLDEDENMSDLSSEISVDIDSYTDTLGKLISPMLAAPGTAISGMEIPSHPLTHASLINLSLHTSPNLAAPTSFVNQPLTPQQSPMLGQDTNGISTMVQWRQGQNIANPGVTKQPFPAGPTHIPFILACESNILAQQFTIVEQSALTEIEWTDLVEMRWSSDKSTSSLDWAEYMAKHDDARGIDVVTARFNLVIKWVLSEIVLTQNIEERARVLSKLIHLAAHARRLHNYATMLQVTIALMSTSCTRLKKTWELVPGPDKSLLKHMEALAQPVRNFHDLRIEMESTDLTSGCIPFLGLYVHDLTYNAQKPAEIRVPESSEPLINFERFRTAAVIIKGLLRLIDASLRYDFEPIHGIVERCLWLSALSDERIDALSKALER